MKKYTERRKHARFRLKEGSFAILSPGSDRKVGQISDISMDGLAFRIVNEDKQLSGTSTLDILISDQYSFLENLPVKIVSDITINSALLGTSMTIKRCGLQFGELSHEQRSQLGNLIRTNTAAEM